MLLIKTVYGSLLYGRYFLYKVYNLDKVNIFWEGHKNLEWPSFCFDATISNIKIIRGKLRQIFLASEITWILKSLLISAFTADCRDTNINVFSCCSGSFGFWQWRRDPRELCVGQLCNARCCVMYVRQCNDLFFLIGLVTRNLLFEKQNYLIPEVLVKKSTEILGNRLRHKNCLILQQSKDRKLIPD